MPGSLLFCQFPKHYALDVVWAYSSGFADRVLPGFQDIEAEADGACEAYFESRMNQAASEDGEDVGAVADEAEEYGHRVYADLEFVRQQVTGLAIAGLYHLWERLVKKFIETSFLVVKPPVTREKVQGANFKDVVGRLRDHFGWDIKAEVFFADLDQLHLVANVVKHSNGKSCKVLLAKAPELFRDISHLVEANDPWASELPRADDLRLEREHFVKFTRSVVQFIKCFPTGERQPVASTR
jgi:hypothetical protein